jgi:hypothetical protein
VESVQLGSKTKYLLPPPPSIYRNHFSPAEPRIVSLERIDYSSVLCTDIFALLASVFRCSKSFLMSSAFADDFSSVPVSCLDFHFFLTI